ncbi:g3721 [Coccomyxa viridis]|uniref:G3721 protein n=1 Tax=Coccomyxa viridis TaxID=1274662 RepID=A0ABP1FNG9_9CHLO
MARNFRCLVLVAAAIPLIGHTAAAKALARAPELKPADELVDWVVKHGGKSDAIVDKSPNTGLRGLFVTNDIKKGDIVLSVPVNISMDIGPAFWTHMELAVSLLKVKLEHPAVWEGFQPYLSSLPGEEDVHTLFSFRKDLIPLLQDPEMEAFVKQGLELTESVFSGTAKDAAATMADLKELKPKEALQITLGELQYWASIIESYSFGALKANNEAWRYLVPLIGMVNHNEEPNADVEMDEKLQAWVLTALQDIRKGEELTFQYRQESNRNDIALLHHFFLNERRPARLCAYDLPRALQKADAQESFTDADYAPGGRLCTLEEAMRLATKLASFPTTESQDRAALERKRNPIKDWRERTIVEFRMLRKEALRLTIDAIKAALQAPKKSAAAAPTPSASVVIEDDEIPADDVSKDKVSRDKARGSAAPPAMSAGMGARSTTSAAQQSEVVQRGAQKRVSKRPQVIVPMADADVGLQEPKFIKVNTPSHTEL